MIPRLARFYGSDPDALLRSTPLALVLALEEMLPRLRAEESMEAAHVAAVGAGGMKHERSRRQFWRKRATLAAAGRQHSVPRPLGRFGEAGIGVRVVAPASGRGPRPATEESPPEPAPRPGALQRPQR